MKRNLPWLIFAPLPILAVAGFSLFRTQDASTAPVEPLPRAKEECLIAAWNIGMEPLDGRIREVTQVLRRLDADVLLLTEVTPKTTANQLANQLRSQGLAYEVHFAQVREKQNIALFVKPEVRVNEIKPVPGSDDGNPDLRQAFSAKVKIGQFDTILIGVHNKSKRQTEGAEPTFKVRRRQAEALAAFVSKETRSTEKDVILLGDYNMIPGEDEAEYKILGANGLLKFVGKPSSDAPFTQFSPRGDRTSFIDGYAVASPATQEWVDSSFGVLRLDKMFGWELVKVRERISDHFPIYARFRTDRDDD